MIENVRRKLNWSSLSRFEQLAFASSIFIWIGVALLGGGLYIAVRNYNLEQTANAQATAIALSATEMATPSATPQLFPAGWSTATPTPLPEPTTTPTRTKSLARPTETDKKSPEPTSEPTAQPMQAPEMVDTPREKDAANVTNASSTKPGHPAPASKPPDRLVISSIDLDAPVVPIGWQVVEQNGSRYSVWEVADRAVSWHKTSALPGHQGNVVLNGHHNIKGEVFRYLVDVEVGAKVLVYVGEQVYQYEVTEKLILKEKGEPAEVRRENARWIAATEDERLTMVTCWPYTNNTHRLVVVAKPVYTDKLGGIQE